MLELIATRPDWRSALEVALTRPPGVPERRAGEDPWAPPPVDRPRRISDDLAWLRSAVDEEDQVDFGLTAVLDTAAVALWEAKGNNEVDERLGRLEARGILDAAGFLLHETG